MIFYALNVPKILRYVLEGFVLGVVWWGFTILDLFFQGGSQSNLNSFFYDGMLGIFLAIIAYGLFARRLSSQLAWAGFSAMIWVPVLWLGRAGIAQVSSQEGGFSYVMALTLPIAMLAVFLPAVAGIVAITMLRGSSGGDSSST